MVKNINDDGVVTSKSGKKGPDKSAKGNMTVYIF